MGDRSLREVYENGVVYEMEVCVKENLLKLSDERKKCVCESEF